MLRQRVLPHFQRPLKWARKVRTTELQKTSERVGVGSVQKITDNKQMDKTEITARHAKFKQYLKFSHNPVVIVIIFAGLLAAVESESVKPVVKSIVLWQEF